jgi:hypothetical protein
MEQTNQNYFAFLNDLRDSGEINMWGAPPYLEAEFGLDRREAKQVFLTWVQSFNKGA